VSFRRTLAIVSTLTAVLAFTAGCDSGAESTTDTSAATESAQSQRDRNASATAPGWGAYPVDTSLDERGVVEAYVEALDARDGARFCSIVAPWISGRFDIAGTDPDESLSRPLRCPDVIRLLIGARWENQERFFKGASIAGFGDPEQRGDVVSVPITVTLRLEEDERGVYEEPLEDVVWLTRDSGAWRVAKLSAVAAAAGLALPYQGDVPADPTSAPDVTAARRAFADEVVVANRRRREREASYRKVGALASCAGHARYRDASKDVADYLHPAPSTPTPQLGAADIRAVRVEAKDGRICVEFELAGKVRAGTTFDFSIQSPNFDWGRAGFSQGFETEVRADGRARVSSGLDRQRRSISVPAAIGVEGNRFSLVVDSASFGKGEPFPGSRTPARPLARFRFHADVTVVLSEKRYLHDDLGNESNSRFGYP
jgi:hypothetical protein